MRKVCWVLATPELIHCPQDVSKRATKKQSSPAQYSVRSSMADPTHLRSWTDTPAFFRPKPSICQNSRHDSYDTFVSDLRPIAFRNASGEAMDPVPCPSVSVWMCEEGEQGLSVTDICVGVFAHRGLFQRNYGRRGRGRGAGGQRGRRTWTSRTVSRFGSGEAARVDSVCTSSSLPTSHAEMDL